MTLGSRVALFVGQLLAAAGVIALGEARAEEAPSVAQLQRCTTPMPLERIFRGQRGYGLSVFSEGTIEVFEVEVVSVVKNFLPGQDEVLVKCSGWELGRTRVIGGMSGSPIYLRDRDDGALKLLGALAYGWSFSLEPLAGITPIQSMLKEGKRPREDGDEQYLAVAPASDTGAPRLEPLVTPLMCAGMSAAGVARLRQALGGFALEPMQSGGVAASAKLDAIELAPGSSIGVQLVDGDIDITGIGTCTYVDGDLVLGFGHPMFGSGEYDLPMTTAYIHTVVGSVQRSFKFGAPIRRVGTIHGDRQSAIVGSFARQTGMIPFSARIENAATGYGADYRFRIIRHKVLTPIFLGGTLFDLTSAQEQTWGPTFCRRTMTVRLRGREPLTFTNTYSTSSAVDSGTFSPLLALLFNEYEKLDIDAVEVKLEITSRNPFVEIVEVSTDQAEYRPGQRGQARVRLRPERAPSFDVTVPFTVPPRFPEGEHRLTIVSGSDLPLETPQVHDLESLITELRAVDRRAVHSLVALFGRADAVLDYEGRRLPNLPDSVAGGLLAPSKSSSVLRGFHLVTGEPVELDGWIAVNGRPVRIVVRQALDAPRER